VRSSVAIDLVRDLVAEGAEVTVYDPKGTEKALEFKLINGARIANSPLEAAMGAEALVIATEWKEFTTVDLAQLHKVMHTPLIFDGRNISHPRQSAPLASAIQASAAVKNRETFPTGSVNPSLARKSRLFTEEILVSKTSAISS
jgi:UDP-N-acetyl-D-mannosaminuronate dehydrogenase